MGSAQTRAKKMVHNFYKTLDRGIRVLLKEKLISPETTVGELLVFIEKEEVLED